MSTFTKHDFLAWAFATEERAEWARGRTVLIAPTTLEHTLKRRWFDTVLATLVRRNRLGQVGNQMFLDVRTSEALRVPDLFFVRRDRERIIEFNAVTGPPGLVVEVISPDSRTRDRDDKLAEYEAFGIVEYWIIDPMNEQIEVRILNAARKYELVAPHDGALHSTVVPGFWIKPEWLWRETRIDEDETYRLIAGEG